MNEAVDWNELKSKGYCVVSRKYGMISRIDRSDWKEHMAKDHSPWSIDDGMKWVEALADQKQAEDQYRRCHSKEIIELGEKLGRIAVNKLPNSSWYETGFIG